ncbi:DNA-directed RNA polymerase subunit N [Halanaeroarchaeum sulfurireducens]|uniref:DNA-directed RNA polymerase subunit Rpo10 n=1 Tax=Halanaeroarchaeum sulfurireducens TaxID=1604004 RepID=A0A0F7PCN4_9EURY|nr:DNA-directed RNA polymerase subunit N [Halanaeroarchaeum sulfurireducens]AKH97940.1 DNA-directed RNA polymerase subunit N [Halanaeroarchaeum sulfurireducens]ALG82334.1 DNA-directed RNA polymerase subunit N [Halanaeroarchaeum sulfurireducens]
MMVPVRCFTCGKPVGEHWDEYKARAATQEGDEDPEEVLDDLGLDRYCCRRMLVSHDDLVDVVSPYQ